MLRVLSAVVVLALGVGAPAYARERAPGAPGGKAAWAPADKQGFGTSATPDSRVWFTLREAGMTEVYYPDLSHPSARSLDFMVDGKLVTSGAVAQDTLTYTQTSATSKWRLVRTYATDPERSVVVVKVRFEALDGQDHDVELEYDPQLYNDGSDDVGWTRGHALLSHDSRIASALVARPSLTRTSSGYKGHTDDLLEHTYDALRPGNVVQQAHTRLTGRGEHRDLQLALGFATLGTAARVAAEASLDDGFEAVASDYKAGWVQYRNQLKPIPAAAVPILGEYETSLLVLKAHEDKDHPGAFVASPSMPWGWGELRIDPDNPRSAPYHLVWARDLYQIATALLAAGDKKSADRALDFLFDDQQLDDGSFPQNSQVDGTPKWKGVQMDQVGLPIVLAWQLGRTGARDWRHIRKAADFIADHGPISEQERWENQKGYAPGTIAAEIAGLVCAAAIARENGDDARLTTYLKKADSWAANVQRWTATTNGPYSDAPYYLRLTKAKDPDTPTRYAIGDSGPSDLDQRRVVDPSFLELVRLGVKRADDPVILNTLKVIDAQLRAGDFWHRYSFDGYGERRDGKSWRIFDDDTRRTLGRAWPIFAGERGEYELLAGRSASELLQDMAHTANGGGMLPEQVWDGRQPTGKSGFKQGEGTFSATPLAWTHAQLVRLAWSAEAGAPVERPKVVADRYTSGGN
ncbi:glycoside hydrolase family 15 protein [Solirubrobacter ginsenosidimutans]|uniref:Glycoside hydrolase family 15 protein n=1 Tax=Solirubrobacter ginsenosidimutans TaxID=490573 RepID=A0A9X3MYL5_9ACTN|nr:glycoside hydrolase family 15 protein [Solirubrobacter ginsenosidimutans]MDA0164937.1 glycoside hydrolase family 15 protein [Solirubrobacter ginsenosidimutans]